MKPINIYLYGERTSIRLEPEFISGLKAIAKRRHKTIHEICDRVAGRQGRRGDNLSSRLRVYIMQQMVNEAKRKSK